MATTVEQWFPYEGVRTYYRYEIAKPGVRERYGIEFVKERGDLEIFCRDLASIELVPASQREGGARLGSVVNHTYTDGKDNDLIHWLPNQLAHNLEKRSILMHLESIVSEYVTSNEWSKKALLLKNLQSYDKMATYRVAGWFGLLCRSVDGNTVVAYPSRFMRQVEPDKSFSAMLNTANAIPNDHSAEGYFHANRDRSGPYGPPPFGIMYPPVPRLPRGQASFHYDGPRNFPPRPNMFVRHGMRGFGGGRHIDGPRPRHFRDPHGFGPPPLHNSFDNMGGRRSGAMGNRDSPAMTDFVQQASSTCDVGSSHSNEQLSASASVMSASTEPGADCDLVAGPSSACSSSHISSDSTTYMLDEAVSALPRQMTALSISTVATAGTSDLGDNGLSTPQSSITSDAGLSVSSYQITSQDSSAIYYTDPSAGGTAAVAAMGSNAPVQIFLQAPTAPIPGHTSRLTMVPVVADPHGPNPPAQLNVRSVPSSTLNPCARPYDQRSSMSSTGLPASTLVSPMVTPVHAGPGMASSSIASPYGSDPSCVGMAVTSLPPYPDSVQQLSLMPYHPSSVPTVPSVGSPHGYVDYYTSPSAASQPAQSAALYLQPVAAANPEYGGGSSAIPAPAYSGYPCVQYSPLVLSPGMYSVQAPPTGRPTLVGPAPGSAYTVPPPPVVVQQSPMEPPTAVAVPPTAPQTPVQLVPVQGQLLCNVARVQPPQVAARPMVAAADIHRIGQPVAVPQFLPVTHMPALRVSAAGVFSPNAATFRAAGMTQTARPLQQGNIAYQ